MPNTTGCEPDNHVLTRTYYARKAAMVSFALLVFAACVWYLASRFRWVELWPVLCHTRPLWLLWGLAISVMPFWFVRTLRWNVLLRRLGIQIPLNLLYMTSAVSLAFSTVTPFQSGEMVKVELLRKSGQVGRSRGYSTFIVERAFDLMAVLLLGVLSLFLSGVSLGIPRAIVMGLSGFFIAGIVLTAVLVWKVRFPGKVGIFQEHLLMCVSSGRTFLTTGFFTTVGWMLVAAGWQACLRSVGIDIGFLNTITVMCTVTLANLASMVPGALGVSETGISLMLQHLNVPAPEAQAGALILRAYSLLIVAIGGAHFFAWRVLRPRQEKQVDV